MFGGAGTAACAGCRNPVTGIIFPAYFQSAATTVGDAVASPDESSCFYHVDKGAVAPCDQCGRFLCGLCMVPWAGRNVCPQCLSAAMAPKPANPLDNRRTLYDSMALGLAILPLIPPFTYFSFLTAPAALFVAIRFWRKPSGLTRRNKVRLWLAVILSLVLIAAWASLFVFAISQILKPAKTQVIP